MIRKSQRTQLLIVIFTVLFVAGCSESTSEPDSDALILRELAEKSVAISGIDDPVLQQLFVNPNPNPSPDNLYSGSHGFSVTDRDATFGVEIFVGTPDQPSREWVIKPI